MNAQPQDTSLHSGIAAPAQRGRALARSLAVLIPLLLGALLLIACGRDKAPVLDAEAAATATAASFPVAVDPSEQVWKTLTSNPAATVNETANAVASGPLARYLPAIKEGKGETLAGLEGAPRYFLDVTLDVISRTLTGTAEIVVTNNSREPWNSILFRLYPNLLHYGGDMFIHSAAVDGYPANFNYQDANSSVKLLLPRPLLPKDKVTVALKWVLGYPSWISDPALYRLFGRSSEMVSLPLFYPTLAVYEQGAAIGSGKWWNDIGTERGDSAFTDTSFFVVRANMASDQVPVTTGTLVSSNTVGSGNSTYVWVTGPVREFLLHTSAKFAHASATAYGTTVTSYWLPGDEAAGRAALTYGVASLRAFSDLFGDYPFADMRIAPAPISYRGMEYPNSMLLGTQLYRRMRDQLEYLIAHEMAHQWWYNMVANDPVNTPWLDEGLAEYSTNMYFEAVKGLQNSSLQAWQRWESPLQILASRGNEVTIAGPVESFTNGNQYETIVYGKGALFIGELRERLGDRRFKLFLQSYLNAHKWGIVTADDFLAALHIQGRPELVQLYQEWVGTPPPPSQTANASGGN